MHLTVKNLALYDLHNYWQALVNYNKGLSVGDRGAALQKPDMALHINPDDKDRLHMT